MESQHPGNKQKIAKITQLKEENQALKEEHQSDRGSLAKMKKEIDFQQRYLESQSRFETIFQQSKLGNKIIAPDLRIVQINRVFGKMLGYAGKDIIGTRITAFAHPDFIHHWKDLQENLWTRKIPSFQIETCLVRKDGTVFWCQITSIIFQDVGGPLGYTIIEDISRQKALEKDLKKLHDHQETLMHMVAHDLKNPLNNIQSLSGFLEQNLLTESTAGQEQSLYFLHLIGDACGKAQAIIRDLLFVGDFKEKATFRKTDLKGLIESQLPLLGVEADKKGVALRFNSPRQAVHAPIHAEKFARLLENLLSNAVKFTPSGGKVTLSLRKKGLKVLLEVSDTGIGIPGKLQASLFDKFTKANRRGTAGESTTGLGLYIVKQIVEMHQGNIRLESRENQGTTFFIELPEKRSRQKG